jgi:hypothetical protein
VPAGDLNLGAVRSINPAGRLVARWRRGWNHQAKALQKQDGSLRSTSPDELATFALAILNVNVPTRILQAAILELAIHVDALVQNHVLILEDLVLMSVHRFTRSACRCEKFPVSPPAQTRAVELTLGLPDASALMRLPSTIRRCKLSNRGLPIVD